MTSLAGATKVFVVDVEAVGAFEFKRRTIRDEFRIDAEFSRLTEGVPPSPFVRDFGQAVADLKVLTVSAPEGWDIDAADATDPETYEKIIRVWGALRERESFFRSAGKAKPPEAGAGTQ